MNKTVCRTLCNIYRSYARSMSTVNMARFSVRSVPDDEKLTIQFKYGEEGEKLKEFCLLRDKNEELGKTLYRLKMNVSKRLKTKKKKKKGDDSASAKTEEENNDIKVKLLVDGKKAKETTTIADTFVHGAEMFINGCGYFVHVNPPAVTKFTVPKSLMQGFPIFPKLDIEFASIDDCEFTWNRIPKNYQSSNNPPIKTEVSRTFSYTPAVSDLGYKLEVSCVPKLGTTTGEEVTVISNDVVEAGPGTCPFETRHLYTTELTDIDEFRVITYNILADVFADTEFTKTQLFPYCAPYALKLDYRIQFILKELQGYNSDILCLQEVDKKVFLRELVPALENIGYQGTFYEKNGNMREGEAIFYRKSKFRLLSDHNIILTNTLKSDPHFEEMLQKVSAYQHVMEKMEKRSTVLQVIVLESVDHPGRKVCVANTHLFFRQKADHIRILQGAICIKHLEQIMKNHQNQGDNISLVFCGDFNANPKSGLHSFLTSGRITPDHHHMVNSESGERLQTLEFSHSLKLESACGYPAYTNFVGSFNAQLDYIFIDDSLAVSSVVPPPQHEEVIQHVALPSVVFPSDHIAQICDVKWKDLS